MNRTLKKKETTKTKKKKRQKIILKKECCKDANAYMLLPEQFQGKMPIDLAEC